MLTFIIPVKSPLVASDWIKFSQLFERTLKSICNQTDLNFKVVVVSNEIPETNFSHQNLHYVKVDFEPPIPRDLEPQESIYKRREIDKGKKIVRGAEYAYNELNTDYIMTVDSDDYVSNNIAAFVNNSNSKIPGWYVNKGYLNFEGKKFLVKTFKFSQLCGSSIIIKPELLQYFINVHPVFYFDHRLTSIGSDINLLKFPFSAGIYNIGNGENIYMSFQNVKKFNNHGNWLSIQSLMRFYNKARNYRLKFITPGLRKEFNFYLVEQ